MAQEPKSYVVITTVGSDRPGIVADISGWLLEHNGNIEDSRMSQLGGEFATLILVSGDPGLEGRLAASRDEFGKKFNLMILTKRVTGSPSLAGTPLLRYELRATSLDHPGIVHRVSNLLNASSINIVSAETKTSAAPFSAAPVFQVQMEIDIPGSVPLQKLRDELRDLGATENIDITLEAAGD